MIDHEFLSPFKQNPWKLFRNTTSETVPPFSVLRITGAEAFNGAIRITVAKPNATQATAYMVNGPFAVPAGKDGICTTLTQAGYLAYDDSDGTPSVGDSYGAQNGAWTARKNVSGFFAVGGSTFTAGVNAVVAIQSSSASGSLVRFELMETLSLRGHAKAKLLNDDFTDSGVEIEVYDAFLSGPPGMWAGLTGYQGWAIEVPGYIYTDPGALPGTEDDEERVGYDIVWMEQTAQTIQFTSTEYMGDTNPDEMNATISWFDHQGREISGTNVLHDEIGQFPDIHSGAKGTAVYDYHGSYYRIVSSQRVAIFAYAYLSATLCPGDEAETIAISGFTVQPVGDYVGNPPTTPTEAAVGTLTAGMNGDKVLLRRTNNTLPSPTWEVVSIVKHLVKVITNLRLTGSSLQYQTTDVYVEACRLEPSAGDWVTWHTTSDDCGDETSPPPTIGELESQGLIASTGEYGESFNSPPSEGNV